MSVEPKTVNIICSGFGLWDLKAGCFTLLVQVYQNFITGNKGIISCITYKQMAQ